MNQDEGYQLSKAKKNTTTGGKWRPMGERIEVVLDAVEEKVTTGGIVIAVTKVARDGTVQARIVDWGPLAGFEKVIVGDAQQLALKQTAKFVKGQRILVTKTNVLNYMDPSAVEHFFLKSADFIIATWEE